MNLAAGWKSEPRFKLSPAGTSSCVTRDSDTGKAAAAAAGGTRAAAAAGKTRMPGPETARSRWP